MNLPGGQYGIVVMQNAATATGNGTTMAVTGIDYGSMAIATLQIVGITTATITFEGTVDGTNWVAIQFTNLNSGSAATTATADGIWRATVIGLMTIRARISAYTSGTITITGVRCA